MKAAASAIPALPLYTLERSDLPKAREVLAEAFARDPFVEYIFGIDRGDKTRAALLHGFSLNYGLKYGLVHAPGPEIEAVAIWLPAGRTEMTVWKAIRAGILDLRRIGPIGERRALFRRLAKYGRYSGEMRRRHAPFPHWYLLVIGAADRYRGRGYAGRLLLPVFEHLDRQGLPCYLETHNPANLPFYEHYRFKVVEEGRLPGTDRPHWAMLRAWTSRVVAGPAKLTE